MQITWNLEVRCGRGRKDMTEAKHFEVCKGCRTGDAKTIILNGKKELSRACLVTVPVLSDCQCPCINCIVKGMCISGCEDFREYTKILQRRIYKEWGTHNE